MDSEYQVHSQSTTFFKVYIVCRALLPERVLVQTTQDNTEAAPVETVVVRR